MANNNVKLNYTEEGTVTVPDSGKKFVVNEKDWTRIKRMVRNIPEKSTGWETALWTSISLMITLSIAFWLAPEDIKNLYKEEVIIIIPALIIITAILFVAGKKINSVQSGSKEIVVNEMIEMEPKK